MGLAVPLRLYSLSTSEGNSRELSVEGWNFGTPRRHLAASGTGNNQHPLRFLRGSREPATVAGRCPDVVDGKDKELIYTLVICVSAEASPLRAPVVGAETSINTRVRHTDSDSNKSFGRPDVTVALVLSACFFSNVNW